jgi:hypothetical protein
MDNASCVVGQLPSSVLVHLKAFHHLAASTMSEPLTSRSNLTRRAIILYRLVAFTVCLSIQSLAAAETAFQVGASIVDVSPVKFPVAVNGGITATFAEKVNSPIHVRAIVLAKGDTQTAIVVVDSCMMPRPFLDEVKAMAAKRTGIASDHLLISATHTHTAPASMSCLGTDADPDYQSFLRLKIVDAIAAAQSRLVPAQVGWGSINAADYMAIRRWIIRPDRMITDPFGNRTVRANMHAGRNWDDVTGESGPEDPELSLIAFQTLAGEPIAVLANLSMHYFSGAQAVHADYFGLYCDRLQQRLTAAHPNANQIVGIMSHGCSGDVWRMDYTKKTDSTFETIAMDAYTDGLLDLTMQAYQKIEFDRSPDLRMAEKRLPLSYRVPDAQRLQWAKQIVEKIGERLPQTMEEVYAREQLYLHEMQSTEVVIQAMRIGKMAIATTPTETYALTGMKLKLQSPLAHTMVFDLAGGGDGYIPPPEQHLLGGYNTWPARSAGLEVNAEPKIVEAALQLLEAVSDTPRRIYQQSRGDATEAILDKKPLAYWRLDDFSGSRATDCSPNQHHAIYEPGVVYFLEGARSDEFNREGETNRACHFAGGRVRANLGVLPESYSVSLWIWNGMPTDGRDVTGWFYSRGNDFGRPAGTEQLGVGGASGHAGKLILQIGNAEAVSGKNQIERWKWHHVKLVRTPDKIEVFLDEQSSPEISVTVNQDSRLLANDLFFGGSSEGTFNWEGRLDEVSVLAGDK